MPDAPCRHPAQVCELKHPRRLKCDESVKIGSRWLHLRTCLT